MPLLVVAGLFLSPVSCTCGASIPHGHSLFQLPNHNHGAVDDHPADQHVVEPEKNSFAHQPHPLMVVDSECDKPKPGSRYAGNFAMSNALEQQDSAVLQLPSASSFGQPMVIAQPSSLITPVAEQCEPVNLPTTRPLEGLATSPETPPPQA